MSRRPSFQFRLYIAGEAENSLQAVANLTAFCKTHLPDRHAIEIVDVLSDPKRALEDAIFMTPTLVRLAPRPVRRIIGSLSQPTTLLQTMGSETVAA